MKMANDTPNGALDPGDHVHAPLAFTYRTYRLDPSSPSLPFLSGKFSALSLRALTTDPGSFGMAYLTEASFTPSDWIARMTRANVHIFICVAHPAEQPEALHTLVHGDWVGMVTQIGPTPKTAYWLRGAGAAEPLPDAVESKWHQTALWIEPAHRGHALAKRMIDVAVAYARAGLVGELTQARVRALTGPTNVASETLYAGRGFPVVGKCTVREAIDGNGNAEYPFSGPKELLEGGERLGLVMEKVVTREE